MGKHVVYIRAREEKELQAAGEDPGEWVRVIVREALNARAAALRGTSLLSPEKPNRKER